MANVRIRYDLPTARVDGKALPIDQIAGVRVLISADGGTNFGLLNVVPPSQNEYLQTELEAGTWVFRLEVEDTNGQRSAPVDLQAVIVPALPNPVSNATATVE